MNLLFLKRGKEITWSGVPSWVELPTAEPGSIDPLGYQVEVDRISDNILPGVTVFTRRARYLSFLCWAIKRTGNNPVEIDKWEIALSVGEFLRHQDGTKCSYFGSGLLKQRSLGMGDHLPQRLHRLKARILYPGLLRSCGLTDDKGNLTDSGDKLAHVFDRVMPNNRPRLVYRCKDFPCLSEASATEKRLLYMALFRATDDARARLKTLREISVRFLKSTGGEPTQTLGNYLRPPNRGASDAYQHLHKAALLELTALPLTRLFIYLYNHQGVIRGPIPCNSKLQLYRVDSRPSGLLSDLSAHLRLASKLGGEKIEISLPHIKSKILQKHRGVKTDGAWVDESWKAIRRGLGGQRPPEVHGYRLIAFASLVRDVGGRV